MKSIEAVKWFRRVPSALAVVINAKIAQAHREPPRHARPTL